MKWALAFLLTVEALHGDGFPPVFFHELGVRVPVPLNKNNSTLYLPIPSLGGCRPESLKMKFIKKEGSFKLVAYIEGKEVFQGIPDGRHEVYFSFPSDLKSLGVMVVMKIIQEGNQEILAWIDSKSEVNYAPNLEVPLYTLFGKNQEGVIPISAQKDWQNEVEGILQAASQLGSLHLPWRVRGSLDLESDKETGIVIGSYKVPFEVVGSHLRVDKDHLFELANYLVKRDLNSNSVILKGSGFVSEPMEGAWKFLFPLRLSQASSYSGLIDFYFKFSNLSSQPHEVLFEVEGVPKERLILPAGIKGQTFKVQVDTSLLRNETFFSLTNTSQQDEVRLEEDSYFEVIETALPSTLKLSVTPRASKGNGLVLMSNFKEDSVQVAFKFLEYLARLQQEPLLFKVRQPSKGEEVEGQDWVFGILTAQDLSYYSPLVDVSYPFITKSGFINSILFPAGEYWSQNYIQIFSSPEPMIALTDLSGDFSRWLEKDNWQTVFTLDTPFALKHENSWIAINYNLRFPPIYLDRFHLEVWWKDNKMIVVALLFAATFFFLRFIWKTLTYKHEL